MSDMTQGGEGLLRRLTGYRIRRRIADPSCTAIHTAGFISFIILTIRTDCRLHTG